MINLFVNYYLDKNPLREKEINYCLLKNLSNPELNTIVLNSQNRLTFKFFFDRINLVSLEDDINIVANSDIYFDQTILLSEKINQDQCYALSRWDVLLDGSAKHYFRQDSQDAWIFRGKIRDNLFSDFNLGYRGCDNRLAHELNKIGYQVSNPSISIKSYHVQNSNVRNYNMTDSFLVPGPYHTIIPTVL